MEQYCAFVKGEEMASRKLWAAAAAASLALVLTSCSAGSGQSTQDGPITLTFWGKSQGQSAQIDLWNEKNPDIQVTFAEQGGDTDLTQALQNATTAGNAPDLFEIPRSYSVSFLVDGVSRDISEWFNNDDGAFAEGAYDFVKVGDTTVGVPFSTNPTFNAINTQTFQKYGFTAPTTWKEFQEQATAMQQAGDVKSMNLPGEDTSYLRDVATQFGAEWWAPEEDGWRVGFNSPESLAAGQVIQDAIDANIVSNYTYIEWDALMQFYSSGQLSQFTTSTWQLPVYEQNFATSVGDWALAPYPAEKSADDLVSPSYYTAYGVSPSSDHPEAAVKLAKWLATDPEAVSILADTVDGSASFPVVADPSAYIDGLLPTSLLGDTVSDAPAVIENAVTTSAAMQEGPNQVAASEELIDWWARALTGDVTMDEVLEHMQEWTVADLESKNIKVVE